MAKTVSIDKSIQILEYNLAKLKFVKSHFPNAKEDYGKFSDETVNQNYTHLDFDDYWSTLSVIPYTALEFEYQGSKEMIKVHSIPNRKRLAQISWRRINGKNVLRFCKLALNLKNDNFKDDMLQECRTVIASFIQKHSNCHLDIKNLDIRLKKIMGFV